MLNEYLQVDRVQKARDVYGRRESLLYIVRNDHDLYWSYRLLHCQTCKWRPLSDKFNETTFIQHIRDERTESAVLSALMRPPTSVMSNHSVRVIDRDVIREIAVALQLGDPEEANMLPSTGAAIPCIYICMYTCIYIYIGAAIHRVYIYICIHVYIYIGAAIPCGRIMLSHSAIGRYDCSLYSHEDVRHCQPAGI